jgi:hypothetical protein
MAFSALVCGSEQAAEEASLRIKGAQAKLTIGAKGINLAPTMLTACRSGQWKLQMVLEPGQAWNARPARAVLFDLETDVTESRDVAAEHPVLVKRLRDQMAGFERSLKPR